MKNKQKTSNQKGIDLFIIGAQKTGSTTVFQWLKSTDTFCTHEQPEMSFFMLPHEYNKGYPKGHQDYFSAKDPRPVLAKHAMAAYSLETLQRIRKHNDKVKVIFIMRDPISRAYSAYWYARKMGWETITTFSKAVEAERGRINDYLKYRNNCYIYNSQYDKHIENIENTFKKENILYLTDNDIKKGPTHTLSKISNFTNLEIKLKEESNTPSTYNKGGLPKSYLAAKLIANISSPNNALKKALTTVTTPQLRSKIRELLTKLNTSNKSYPPISLTDKGQLEIKLKASIERYNALLKQK